MGQTNLAHARCCEACWCPWCSCVASLCGVQCAGIWVSCYRRRWMACGIDATMPPSCGTDAAMPPLPAPQMDLVAGGVTVTRFHYLG